MGLLLGGKPFQETLNGQGLGPGEEIWHLSGTE